MALIDHLQGLLFVNQIGALKVNLLTAVKEHFPTDIVTKSIDQNAMYYKKILVLESEFLIELLKINKLSEGSINFLGSIGRHCVNRYVLESHKNAFNYILKVINHLKQNFEHNLPDNAENYQNLLETVDSFVKFHKMENMEAGKLNQEKEHVDNALLSQLSHLKTTFKKIDIPTNTYRIPWDEL